MCLGRLGWCGQVSPATPIPEKNALGVIPLLLLLPEIWVVCSPVVALNRAEQATNVHYSFVAWTLVEGVRVTQTFCRHGEEPEEPGSPCCGSGKVLQRARPCKPSSKQGNAKRCSCMSLLAQKLPRSRPLRRVGIPCAKSTRYQRCSQCPLSL